MAYQVRIDRPASAELRDLPEKNRKQILKRLVALATDPRPAGVKKLAGHVGLYRIRSGDYRIVFRVNDATSTVLVLLIDHRGDVYRHLDELP